MSGDLTFVDELYCEEGYLVALHLFLELQEKNVHTLSEKVTALGDVLSFLKRGAASLLRVNPTRLTADAIH